MAKLTRYASSNRTKWKIGSMGSAENEIKPSRSRAETQHDHQSRRSRYATAVAASVDPQQRCSSSSRSIMAEAEQTQHHRRHQSEFWSGFFLECILEFSFVIHWERVEDVLCFITVNANLNYLFYNLFFEFSPPTKHVLYLNSKNKNENNLFKMVPNRPSRCFLFAR